MHKLYALDFDGVLAAANTDNVLCQAIADGLLPQITSHMSEERKSQVQNMHWLWLKNTLSNFDPVKLTNVILHLLKRQDKVTITSHNRFQYIIEKFLTKNIFEKALRATATLNTDVSQRMVADLSQKILVIAKKPANHANANKNPELEQAIDLTHFTGNRSDVLLIDDNENNITAASDAGYQALLFCDDVESDDYLDKMILHSYGKLKSSAFVELRNEIDQELNNYIANFAPAYDTAKNIAESSSSPVNSLTPINRQSIFDPKTYYLATTFFNLSSSPTSLPHQPEAPARQATESPPPSSPPNAQLFLPADYFKLNTDNQDKFAKLYNIHS